MRNFLEVSPNDWGTKRTICEMDLNRWFPREKDPMILIVAKSSYICICFVASKRYTTSSLPELPHGIFIAGFSPNSLEGSVLPLESIELLCLVDWRLKN